MSREPSAFPTLLDRAAWLYATGCGIGLCPKGPGTAGSLLGPMLVFGWQLLELKFLAGMIVAVISVFVGVAAAGHTARRANCEDPGFIVCDEVAAFSIVFFATEVTWLTALVGFAWFRLFDIWKPWPIRRFERLPGGWGIMADDLVAGAFAAVALQGTMWLVKSVR